MYPNISYHCEDIFDKPLKNKVWYCFVHLNVTSF
jgi:hypothetical protein